MQDSTCIRMWLFGSSCLFYSALCICSYMDNMIQETWQFLSDRQKNQVYRVFLVFRVRQIVVGCQHLEKIVNILIFGNTSLFLFAECCSACVNCWASLVIRWLCLLSLCITTWLFFVYIPYLYIVGNLHEEGRASETTTEDMFIRKFMGGTWHRLLASEVIIKRRHNMIIIACLVFQAVPPRKMYFLSGYTEELLSTFLNCPVKVELQTVKDKKDIIFKYI